MKPNDVSPTQNVCETRLSLWKRARQRYDQWYKLQSRVRLTVFYSGGVALLFVFCAVAWMLSHPPHKLTLNDVIAFGLCEFSFLVLLPLLTLRWKSPKKLT
jgi:hypothetical protein